MSEHSDFRSSGDPSDRLGSRPHPSRRRDKPQLSCNACRKRKVRCDRLQPCSNCSSRGLGPSCTYSLKPALAHGQSHVQDRVNKLEDLVLSLIRHSAPCSQIAAIASEGNSNDIIASDRVAASQHISNTEDLASAVPSSPSDYGSIRLRHSDISYVSSAHWAAVLEGIAELRDDVSHDDDYHEMPVTVQQMDLSTSLPGPQLLYGGGVAYGSLDSILESIPPKPVVDRLVSRYFNDLDMASGIPHTGKFLREYTEFWKCPQETPIAWIGLLFGIICVTSQVQDQFNSSTPPSGFIQQPNPQLAIFREKIIQCLIQARYTQGGPYILETLLFYIMVEIFPSKDTTTGLRILLSTIVSIAMQTGHHRDATHFPNISPFAAEMRRRVWALIVQMDFTISMQMGLPRIIKESQTDVSEPRNIFDEDFNESTTILPPSRPEAELTPTLYTLAKIRLVRIGGKIADTATEPKLCPYGQVLSLDKSLDEARAALPVNMRWDGLESSLFVSAQVLMKRIWLEICVHRLRIVLHKRFMLMGREGTGSETMDHTYPYSRDACLLAAVEILELQHLVDEETGLDGRLYQTRWRVTASFSHDFLLATSLLCFYVQSQAKIFANGDHDIVTGTTKKGEVSIGRIKQLLRKSQFIWLRESGNSLEARKAATALLHVFGHPDHGPGQETCIADSHPFSDIMPGSEFLNLDLPIEESPWNLSPSVMNSGQPWGGTWQWMDA